MKSSKRNILGKCCSCIIYYKTYTMYFVLKMYFDVIKQILESNLF